VENLRPVWTFNMACIRKCITCNNIAPKRNSMISRYLDSCQEKSLDAPHSFLFLIFLKFEFSFAVRQRYSTFQAARDNKIFPTAVINTNYSQHFPVSQKAEHEFQKSNGLTTMGLVLTIIFNQMREILMNCLSSLHYSLFWRHFTS